MSRVNQSFVKAYRKTSNSPDVAAISAMRAARRAEDETAAAAEPLADESPSDIRYYIDAPHTFGAHGWTTTALAGANAAIVAAAVETEIPRPLFEVPAFEWPNLVEELLAIAPAQFEPLVADWSAGGAARRLVLVTSASRQEGRGTVLMALARLAAARGLRVAMVDADFGKPHMAAQLGILPQADWQDVLFGSTPIEDALVESVADGVTLLPLAEPMTQETVDAAHRRLTRSLESLRERFDLVLVDGGAMNDGRTTAAALAGWFDEAVLVRDLRRTPLEIADRLGQRLAAAGIGDYAVVENFVRRVGE